MTHEFPAADFRAWLDAMYAKGLVKTDIHAGELIGATNDTVCNYKLRGCPPTRAKTIALACAAALNGLEPWKQEGV